MHAFLRKSPLLKEHLFEWLKTENFSTACGTVTLKSAPSRGADAPHVHPRPRKRPSRCTLDCGFKTSESPALRGFVAERAPIRGTSLYLVLKSNGLRHSKNSPVKFGFSSKSVPANIAKKLPPQVPSQTISHHDFQLRSQTAHVRLHGRKRVYTLGFRRKIAHSGSHAETGAFPPSATVRLVLPVKLPPKEQPEKVDARLWRVSASSGTAAPLGCENSIT